MLFLVYLSRPCLVSGLAAVSWPSLTRVVSGRRRVQDEEMFTFVCNMQQEPAQRSPAQLRTHILCPGLKITQQLIQIWQFISMSKYSIESIVAVQLN